MSKTDVCFICGSSTLFHFGLYEGFRPLQAKPEVRNLHLQKDFGLKDDELEQLWLDYQRRAIDARREADRSVSSACAHLGQEKLPASSCTRSSFIFVLFHLVSLAPCSPDALPWAAVSGLAVHSGCCGLRCYRTRAGVRGPFAPNKSLQPYAIEAPPLRDNLGAPVDA